MMRFNKTRFTGAALGFILLVAVIQLYLFETVLGAVMDGDRTTSGGAFMVSLALSAVALFLAFKIPGMDRPGGGE
ncbi:MAG TPA: DUF6755 family protein [Holophagaceae bacterium]|nr:DUF6755 family protein [Holophagaceae bacterium]HJW09263.1 DUF6755 family protein [Holophagaceae bacterium]